MSKYLTKSLFFIAIFFIIGCHFSAIYNNRQEDKNDAEKIIDKFYSLQEKLNYNETYKLFSTRFFAITDTQKLNNLYDTVNTKLGIITDFSIERWETQAIRGTNAKTDYAFILKVKRKNYDSEESITLSKENDTIKIVGYHVNSYGFIQ